ncbi:MAG TPA: hypothetical protein PKN58_05300 [Candidatus Marinimicrobia bacterium]|jgi:hypothetical protein|nr:hypothetical protein [Candidatus Neomarinimicrobiota bacterium]
MRNTSYSRFNGKEDKNWITLTEKFNSLSRKSISDLARHSFTEFSDAFSILDFIKPVEYFYFNF